MNVPGVGYIHATSSATSLVDGQNQCAAIGASPLVPNKAASDLRTDLANAFSAGMFFTSTVNIL